MSADPLLAEPYEELTRSNAFVRGASRRSSAAPTETEECGICLEPLDHKKKLIARTRCSHRFHDDCLVLWRTEHSSCPLCRTDLRPQDISFELLKRRPSVPDAKHPSSQLASTITPKTSSIPPSCIRVTRAHRCRVCGGESCIVEHPLVMPGFGAIGVSHYECNACHEIYDTYSRVPWT